MQALVAASIGALAVMLIGTALVLAPDDPIRAARELMTRDPAPPPPVEPDERDPLPVLEPGLVRLDARGCGIVEGPVAAGHVTALAEHGARGAFPFAGPYQSLDGTCQVPAPAMRQGAMIVRAAGGAVVADAPTARVAVEHRELEAGREHGELADRSYLLRIGRDRVWMLARELDCGGTAGRWQVGESASQIRLRYVRVDGVQTACAVEGAEGRLGVVHEVALDGPVDDRTIILVRPPRDQSAVRTSCRALAGLLAGLPRVGHSPPEASYEHANDLVAWAEPVGQWRAAAASFPLASEVRARPSGWSYGLRDAIAADARFWQQQTEGCG